MFTIDPNNSRKLVAYYRVKQSKKRGPYRTRAKVRNERIKVAIALAILFFMSTSTVLGGIVKHNRQVEAQAKGPFISPLPKEPKKTVLRDALSVQQMASWEDLKAIIVKIAPIYDYPVKVAVAQAALESGYATSDFCVNRKNCFGIGAYDWNPDMAFNYSSWEENVIDYMRLIKTQYGDAYEARSNPDAMIRAIKADGYATDPDYVAKIESLPEWTENEK